jgi:hypothetical protein
MNSTMTTEAGTVERLHADHGITKRLGLWTSASQFDVRVRYVVLVLDVLSRVHPGRTSGSQERRLPDRGRHDASGALTRMTGRR